MLVLGIVESPLELVPSIIAQHSAVQAAAKARRKKAEHTLLDEALHSAALKMLPDCEKRGRPDVLHRSLLTALDSVLARENLLKLFVHTSDEAIIEVKPETRLPRRFARFTGLMEQLLLTKRVPPKGTALMQLRRRKLAVHIQRLKPSCTFLLTETGTPTPPTELAKSICSEDKPLVMIGGFAHGFFTSTTMQLAERKVCVYPAPLPASTVIGIVLHSVANQLKLSEQRFNPV
ncbi:MAG: 16S rRNA methyltransferase [Promethearchaeota archaeon]